MEKHLQKLAEINPDDILHADDKHFSLGDARSELNLLVQGARDILEYPELLNEIPRRSKQNIGSTIEQLIRTLEQIKNRKSDPQWLTSNLNGQVSDIQSKYGELYPWLVTAIREYKNSQDAQKQEMESLLKELKSATSSAKKSSKLASEASSEISTAELSKFFDEVANGSTKSVEALRTKYKKTWKARISSYGGDARRWLFAVLFSIAATGATAYLIFGDIANRPMPLEEVIARGLILTAPAYAIKFSAKNYSYNKHLQVTNTHRAVVMKTLLAFLQREEIRAEEKALVVTEAAKQVFKPDGITGDGTREADSVIEIPVPWKKG